MKVRRKGLAAGKARQAGGPACVPGAVQAFLDEKSSVSESLRRLESACCRKESSNMEGEDDDIVEQQPRLFRDVPRLEAHKLHLQMVFLLAK